MNKVVTYINPKLKKLVSGTVLVTSVGAIFLAGCGINKNSDGNENTIDTSISAEEQIISYKAEVNASNLNEEGDLVAFIAEDGRIIATVPIENGSVEVDIPGSSKTIYSPVLDQNVEIPEIDSDYQYELNIDYKDNIISFSEYDKGMVN